MLSITNPRQTVLITCRANTDILGKEMVKDNIIAVDWHMPCSFQPMMYAISVGKTRFSLKLIHQSRCFVVNFISKDLEKAVVFCGRNSGEHLDKFEGAGLTKVESTTIDCPRIKQALAYAECEVVNEIDAGDHIIFLAEVLKSELIKKDKRLFHIEKDNFTTTVK